MNEPADPAPDPVSNPPPGGGASEVLDTFKNDAEAADEQDVHDAIGGRPRLNWSPVTDGGGGRATTDRPEDQAGFHFDLGGALARLGSDDEPGAIAPVATPPTPSPAASAPPAAPPAEQLPQRGAAPAPEAAFEARVPDAPPLEPLPRRGERPAAAEAPPVPAPAPAPVREPAPSPYASAR